MASVKVVRPNFVIPDSGWAQYAYWERKSDAKSFVYVIRAAGDSPIKVGKANDVVSRIASLQTGNPRTLELLQVLVGGLELERELHSMLRGNRLVGEWFDGPPIQLFLDTVEDIASEMVLFHKNGGRVPTDYRMFSPFKEREARRTQYTDWTEQMRDRRAAT